MLQPMQLERVARRFPTAIESVRAVLADSLPDDAASRPGAYSLAAVASHLHSDGAFRRNLQLHLVNLAYGGASNADLLAIVTLAAVGTADASTVREDDASQVLHFILAALSPRKPKSVPATAPADRATWYWPLALACVSLCAVWVTHALLHKAAVPQETTGLATDSPSLSEGMALRQLTPTVPYHTPFAPAPPRSMVPRGTLPSRSRSAPERATIVAKATPAPMLEAPAKTYTAPVGPSDVPPRSQIVPPTTTVQPRTSGTNSVRPGTPVATPTAVLSQRLGARTVPASDPAIDSLSGRAYPRLWRRHPAGSATPDAGTLLADNVLPSRLGAYTAPLATTSAGTVRPVSLGMMAANILYSPAPAYPAAAAVARVQGQVKIQAEVDRDGTVASARVVSGPPLLRDAALDAVLRWRYRPRTLAGKPVTAADTAVVEFELP